MTLNVDPLLQSFKIPENLQGYRTPLYLPKQIFKQRLADKKIPITALCYEKAKNAKRLGAQLVQDNLALRILPLLFREKRRIGNDVDPKIDKQPRAKLFEAGLALNRIKDHDNLWVLDSS